MGNRRPFRTRFADRASANKPALALLLLLLCFVRTENLERSESRLAVGMLSVLFVGNMLLEFVLVPGILGATAVFVHLVRTGSTKP